MAPVSKLRSVTNWPEFNVFVFAVLLNYPWEFLQVPLYEGMAAASHWEGIKVCTIATLGDGVIMLLAYWSVVLVARQRSWILRPRPIWLIAFIGVGVAITVAVEQLALASDNPGWGWRYAKSMPVVPVFGIGLSPLLQWLLLPLLAAWFVRRQLESRVADPLGSNPSKAARD